MDEEWKKVYEESDKYNERRIERAIKSGGIDGEFARAERMVLNDLRESDLLPTRGDYGEVRYTVRQGIKAACYAREDAAITLVMQHSVLKRLDVSIRLIWIAIGLLAYIAYRVS